MHRGEHAMTKFQRPMSAAALILTFCAFAAEYPTKPFRLIVPAAAGGSADLAGRLIAGELTKQMGQQIVVDNRGGTIGYEAIARAAADGYTFGLANFPYITNPLVFSNLPYVRAGRLRAIGVTTLKRLPVMPDLPTIAESGLPGFEAAVSSGYIVPARTPRDMVLRLNAELNKALKSTPVTARAAVDGYVIAGGTPEQFAEHVKRETVKWPGVFKAAGSKPQ
jgi:tripartite-type tricarboxylate transporter receptor subunit TctC